MKKRKRMKISQLFAVILAVTLLMGNTLTVFAHPHVDTPEVFVVDTENIFIDEEGNVYIIEDDVIMPLAECNHSYTSGTYQQHTKLSNGGCIVYVFSAERCGNCGIIIMGELINKYTNTVCTH